MVPAITQGRVNVGSGTLYNLLEQFAQAGMIRDAEAEGFGLDPPVVPEKLADFT